MTISIEIKNSISQIDEKDWEQLCAASKPYHYQYMRAFEASKLDCKLLYAVASVNHKIVGIAIASIWKLRFPYKLFLTLTTMGTPVNTGLPIMILPEQDESILRKELIYALKNESTKRGVHLFIGRDFPNVDYVSNVCLDKLYDCAYLNLPWTDFEQYLSQHPKRKNIRRDLRSLNKAGFTLEIRERKELSKEEAQRLYDLWLQLYDKYNSSDQIHVTKDFFIQMSKLEHAVLFLLRNQTKEIIAFDLCFTLDNCLESTYCGVDFNVTGRLPVHRVMGYYIIRYAIDKKYSHINFGISNEQSKVEMGCHLVPVYTWISVFPNWLEKLIRPILYRFVLNSN